MVYVADRRTSQPGLVKARKLEARYAAQLRKIARHVGEIIRTMAPDGAVPDLSTVAAIQIALRRYAEAVTPWAKATGNRMLQEVAIKERRAWAEHARLMGREMRRELMEAPTGHALRAFLNEQVRLITSLPTEAGQRVHRLALEGLQTGGRVSEIAAAIMRSGEVAASRANLIARTEVSRAASGLTMVRAQHVGSTHYVWRTAGDSDVRPSHAGMEGKPVAWNDPPTLDGLTGHAGMLPNCRCYPEPVLPEIG